MADDLPAVCSLYERTARSGSSRHPAALEGYFERTFLNHPWVDGAVPSFVHEDRRNGIVGFLGSHVRRVRLDGRPLRTVYSGPLVAAPDSPGSGALLTRRLLSGPQDLTLSDGATEYMRRIWTGLGGDTAVASSISWTKVLRPAAAATFLTDRVERRGLTRTLRAIGPTADEISRRVLRRVLNGLPQRPDSIAEALTPDLLLAQVAHAHPRPRIHLDYDHEFLAWLFDLLQVAGTNPCMNLVRDPTGDPLGWYVYDLSAAGVAQVLQIGAPSGRLSEVLEHLFWHADSQRASAVIGRLEPALFGTLRKYRCLLVETGLYSLVHTHDTSLLGLIGTARAFLSTLDGAGWMRHNRVYSHTQPVAL
ncbi:MAG: hypothetical protein L0K86_04400 [Actinomycetia bacterium]|nr:hypothetical protein [Actinomycetes bacterium]